MAFAPQAIQISRFNSKPQNFLHAWHFHPSKSTQRKENWKQLGILSSPVPVPLYPGNIKIVKYCVFCEDQKCKIQYKPTSTVTYILTLIASYLVVITSKSIGKHHWESCSLQTGIAQIAIAPPPCTLLHYISLLSGL